MRKINDIIKDTYYKKEMNNPALRIAVRAILLDDNDNIAYLHIKGEDKFGKRDHLESPGGGVDENETLEEALKRELLEELGAKIEILNEIGYIDIEYSLLNRIDRENYFLCRLKSLTNETHLLAYEKTLFDGLKWIQINDAISFFKTNKNHLVGNMIHEREMKVLQYILDNNLV